MSLRVIAVACGLTLAGSAIASGPKTDRVEKAESFKGLVAPFFDAYCIDCHNSDKKSGKFSLEGIDSGPLGDRHLETWRIIYEQIRFEDMPPRKKEQPTRQERAAVLAWIRGELLKTQRAGVIAEEKLRLPQFGNYVDHQFLFGERLPRVIPAPPRIWRLRPAIYSSTLPGLAERVSGLANGLNVIDGAEIKDYASSYFLDEAATPPLLGNAKKIADAMLGPRSRDRVFRKLISDEGPPSAGTISAAIDTAFRKALGRAPTADEKQRFAGLHAKSVGIGGYRPAARSLLTGILMQPEVLFRQELGDGKPDAFGRVRLSQREIGYALSYALADKPVEEFLAAASAGKLATRGQVTELVRTRLRDDSKLQDRNPRVLQFFREYFNYPFAKEVFKDKPEGGMHESGTLVSDLETTIRDILRADRQVLAELLTTRKYHVNARYKNVKKKGVLLEKSHDKRSSYPTAYNLPLDWKWSSHLQPVEFPRGERAGVLTHPAWLAAWSGNFDNHPVQRGKWIRTHLLGGTVPDVPIGVDARVPEAEHTSFRDRLEHATRKSECWRCHRKMDPLGVTLERYDHYGRFQRLDAGQPVDASGIVTRTGVPDLDGRKVSGPVELMEVLAASRHVEQVFVRHVFRYFMGRNETLGDANTLQDAHKAYRDSDGSFNEIVVSLLRSESFLLRQLPRLAAK